MTDRTSKSLGFVESFLSIDDLRELFASACEELGVAFDAVKCVVLPLGERLVKECTPLEWSTRIGNEQEDKHTLKLAFALNRLSGSSSIPLAIERVGGDRRFEGVIAELEVLSCSSVLVGTARAHGEPNACVCLFRAEDQEPWSHDEVELFSHSLKFFGLAIHRAASERQLTAEHLGENDPSLLKDDGLCPQVRYDKLGRVSFASRTFCEQTGLRASELIGMHFSTFLSLFVTENERERVLKEYSAIFESALSLPQGIVYRLQHRTLATTTRVADWIGPLRSGEGYESTLIPLHALSAELSNQTSSTSETIKDQNRYQRLVEHSDAIIFHSEPNHRINFISRRALDFFGVAPEDFVSGVEVHWYDLVHLDDRERMTQRANEAQKTAIGFDDEFRVVNHITGQVRWLLSKLVPVLSSSGTLLGWDGFGIDITARKETQEALNTQSKKVRALYTVSSAIRGYLDPANIASRGLAALCDATGANAGLCFLYPSKKSKKLSLVADHGFSEEFSEKTRRGEVMFGLSSYVSEHGQSVVVPDIRTDPRANRALSDDEGMRSALLVPISVEEEVLGTLGLFHEDISQFDGGDVMLAAAAANQIGLAARQANLFAAYRQQTKNLSALYRLSHVLSGFLSIDEVFQKSFEVIRDELGFKRLWLGLLDETGTRLVGQSAYGPGWRRKLVQINVEVAGEDHPIAQVVRSKMPVIIGDPESLTGDFGVKRFFSRFAVKSVGLVPLISGGQVLGVLAFQPDNSNTNLEEEEITLISSLAAEIARALRAKRLEERAGDSEKMRTAGLLAAGIAHNFNNLLQAILGQASLLEMQDKHSPEVQKAASIVNDAATKGASLVKQLMSFANLEEPSSEICDLEAVVRNGSGTLERQLASNRNLNIALSHNLPKAFADPRQVMRILSALVLNANEATDENGEVTIFTDRVQVQAEGPHYEVPVGDYIRIGVRDNGKGMDAETRRRCFEPFFTTKNVDPTSGIGLSGAGLGLAAAYALARKNGGRLVVESTPGRGSLFLLYLPVANQDSLSRGLESGFSVDPKLKPEVITEAPAQRGVANLKLVESKTLKKRSN
jgi:PAS domain S-box-containing protein